MTHRAALAFALLSSLAGCSSSTPEPRSCARDDQCGEGAICVSGVCAGNAAPGGQFATPTGLTTNRLVRLEANTRDPEGRSLTHRWSVEPHVGGCAPEPEPGDRSWLDVVFWCPGTYRAAVVPIDDQGLEGQPLTALLEVTEASGAPIVVPGGAITATHTCDLGIPECRVVGPDGTSALALSAAGSDPAGGALAYEWMAIPPESASFDPGREPSFQPDNQVAAPTTSIASDGGPIAGVFRFRVRARNAQGLIGRAFQDVVVANSPPVAAPPAIALSHTYLDGRFIAEGDVDTGATDADGDPLFAEATLSPTPPAGCEETVTSVASGRVHVRLACQTAGGLIGEAERSLSGAVFDVNGASAPFAASITVTNNPPILGHADGSNLGTHAIDHRVEPCALATAALCFVAEDTDPFVAVDPDGDPLGGYQLSASVAPARKSSKGTVTTDGSAYRFRFETPTTLPTEFRSAAGATGFTLGASVADPFGATGTAAEPLTVANRAPVVAEAVPAASVQHAYVSARRRYEATAVGALLEDPDGDPLVPSVTGDPSWRSSVALEDERAVIKLEYAWDFTLGGEPPLSTLLGYRYFYVTASDGWASVRPSMALTILDRPGTVTAPVTSVENCACVSGKYAASGTGMPVPVELADPDGDPHLIAAIPSFAAPAQPVPVACVPGWCYPKVNVEPRYVPSGEVSARPGANATRASASFRIAPTCSVAGHACL